jgi:hypothetical protein
MPKLTVKLSIYETHINTGEYEQKAKELNFTNAKRPVITGGINAQMPKFLNGILLKR